MENWGNLLINTDGIFEYSPAPQKIVPFKHWLALVGKFQTFKFTYTYKEYIGWDIKKLIDLI